MPKVVMSLGEELRREEVLWLLGSISALYRLLFDAGLVSQQFLPPYSMTTFPGMACALALKTKACCIDNIGWQELPLPAIAFFKQGSETSVAYAAGARESLAMFMLFTPVMAWLRQYLVLYIGNRIYDTLQVAHATAWGLLRICTRPP